MANTTDIIVPALSRNFPYYDDFDGSKNYVRVLFRPSNAVQGRELTQLQTILQKQIQRFGDGIYTDGSMVTGGEITYQAGKEGITHINLSSTFAGNPVVAAVFLSNTITLSSNTSPAYQPKASVLATDELNSSEPPTLVVKYLTQAPFLTNANVQISNNSTVQATIGSGTPQGLASIVSINPGVYFFRGFFIAVPSQTIILDKYDSTPSYSVGLQFNEAIIDENSDTTLLDPAQETSNYQAPGATRYQLNLTLSKRSLTSTDTSTFIELIRIVNGVITKKVNYPVYSNIEKEMARRTYDQAGNFTVKPFIGTVIPQVSSKIDGTVTVTAGSGTLTGANTSFLIDLALNSIVTINNQTAIVNTITSNTSATIVPGLVNGANNNAIIAYNPNKLSFKLSPGKAYIKGYEFRTPSAITLDFRRGRDYANITSYSLESYLGNYVFVSGIKGLADIGAMEHFDIHRVQGAAIDFSSQSNYSNTIIGSCYIRAMEYSSASNTANSLSHIYKAFLFGVSIANSTYTLSSANGIATFYNAGFPANYNKYMNIDISSKDNQVVGSNTFITDTGYNSLVFPYPQHTVKAGSITSQSYQYRKVAANVTFTSGSATVTVSSPEAFVGSGVVADGDALNHFIVTLKTLGTLSNATYNIGDIIPFTSGTGRSITVSPATTATFAFGVANNFTADILYSTTIAGTPPPARSKTAVICNTSVIAVGGGTTISNTNTSVFTANAQVQVTNANNVIKVPGVAQNTYIADVYAITQVLDFGNFTITQANLSSAVDITNSYILDNGQRDNHYGQAAIFLKPGRPTPTGPLVISLNYYTHSGTSGYLSVDSYPNAGTDTGYTAIPTYKSPKTGIAYTLRDCIDWRPIVQNATETLTFLNPRILEPEQYFTSGFSYYLPRIDKIVLSEGGIFNVIEGVSALVPGTPNHKSSDMLLYTLNIPAYTFYPTDVDVRYNENKRYTMADIGRLEDRIQNLEYYTSLSLLEQAASATTTTNTTTGLTNFQNGIIVDNFTGHQVGDVLAPDYNCSMDFQNGELHAAFTSNNAGFVLNAGQSANYSNTGGTITMSYTMSTYVTQAQATAMTCVNLFNYTQWIGTLTLLPDNDTWKDINTRPQVLVNLEGENDAWEAIASYYNSTGFGTRYGDWTQTGSGVSTTSVQQSQITYERNTQTSVSGLAFITGNISSTVTTTSVNQTRTVTSSQIVPQTITQTIGDLVVDVSVQPWCRPIDLVVASKSLIPLASFYVFIDEVPAVSYWMNPTLIQVDMTTVTGVFSQNVHEIVTGTSGGSGTLISQPGFLSVSSNTVYPYVVLANTSGIFNANDTITGSLSGATAKILTTLVLSANVAAQSANALQLQLANTAPTSNTFLVGQPIFIAKGFGEGQARVCNAYNGVTKVASFADPWLRLPAANSVYSLGMPQTTPLGILGGSLHIPNNSAVRIPTGQRTIMITTSPSVDQSDVASYAKAPFYAQGLIETTQNTLVSTRVPTLVESSTTQDQTVTSSVVSQGEFTPTYVQVVNPGLNNNWTPPGVYNSNDPGNCTPDTVRLNLNGGQSACVANNTYLPGNPAGFLDNPTAGNWSVANGQNIYTPDAGSSPTANIGATTTATPTYGAPAVPGAPTI